MKAVVFDLDDTLYPEIEFVHGGFRATARFLSDRHLLPADEVFDRMLAILERDGRGKVFDSLLRALDLYSETRVLLLVHLYRSHSPSIHLYDDALPTIARLRSLNMRTGLLTDGMASVQRNKIAALGLASCFDAILCTDELGPDHCKPSTKPYQVMLELLQVTPSEAAYVGDNLDKDFLGANALGMTTVQVLRPGPQRLHGRSCGSSAAQIVVSSLDQVVDLIT